MSCMPTSGGCERHRTDPFVNHLNETEGSRYSHEACLDRLHRDSPQPEALYVDPGSGSELVIERKTVVWPLDYAARHRTDHFIADVLSRELRDVAEGRPLSIYLDPAALMPRDELSVFAHEIAHSVTLDMGAILSGRTIGSRQSGRRWSCFLDPEERSASDEPESGLIVRWIQRDEHVSPDALPAGLVEQLRRLFQSTVGKFRNYSGARGILLLDPYGAIRYSGGWWWSRAFGAVRVPGEVAEVWLATYDWVADFEEGWIFERLYPCEPREHAV